MAASDCRTLFRTGMRTAEIAELVGVGQRRVQQLVSDLQAVRNAQMCDEELDEIILASRSSTQTHHRKCYETSGRERT